MGYAGFGVQLPNPTTSDFEISARARMGLDSGGASYPIVLAISGESVGIGTATPSALLYVNGDHERRRIESRARPCCRRTRAESIERQPVGGNRQAGGEGERA